MIFTINKFNDCGVLENSQGMFPNDNKSNTTKSLMSQWF